MSATPAPWTVRPIGTTTDRDGRERTIANVCHGGEIIADCVFLEDALLIVAVHPMRAALESIAAYPTDDANKLRAWARAALAQVHTE